MISASIPAIGLAVSLLAAARSPVPPPPSRSVQPRLSGEWTWRACTLSLTNDRVVARADCGVPNVPRHLVSITVGDCDDVTQTHREAVDALAAVPACTDAAIRTLERLTKRPDAEATVVSDLAAAYLVRARRKDRPSDLLNALDAATRAVRLAPNSSAAHFNQAIALEELGFVDEAIASWDELRRTDRGAWAREATGHWASLTHDRDRLTATGWSVVLKQLPDEARARKRAAVADLIAPFPAPAIHYVHTTMLPAWARASAAGDVREARLQLDAATLVATELARLTGDSYLRDVIDQIRANPSKQRLAALRQGILLLSTASTPANFLEAEAALRKARSPMRLVATVGLATKISAKRDSFDEAIALLTAVDQEASRKGYRYIRNVIRQRRGFVRLLQSRYLDALAEYDAAERISGRMHDEESLGIIHARKLGILRIVGEKNLAWREALKARRYERRMVDASQRQVVLGETALTAIELGHPRIALSYQTAAIDVLQGKLRSIREDDPQFRRLRGALGVAFGRRAAIRGRLEEAGAMEDVKDATRLVRDAALDESDWKIRLAQIRETEGELLLRSDPARAVMAFSDAYSLAAPIYYRTYSAALLVARAEARLLNGERSAAEADVRAALAELRAEERGMVANRERGKDELLWTPYFSRSRDTYTRLIRQLADERKTADAFAYTEQARAYELLNLLKSPRTPHLEPLDVTAIQRVLPADTFIVEYWVAGDRTYAWLIGREDFEPFVLTVTGEQLDTWSEELVRSAVHRRDESFNRTLAVLSAALLHQPVGRVAQIAAARKLRARLVFVPDAAVHGVPFAALPDPSKPNRRLVEQYPISLAPSATLYAASLSRNGQFSPERRPRVMLVADPAFDESLDVAYGLAPLGDARKETDNIAQAYESVATVVPLRGVHATVPAFLDLARRSTIIHFAGHAVANPDAPSRSLLLLAPSRGQSGALDAEELLRSFEAQDARLVVLAACSTAGGVPVGVDGLAPLVKPILAAGVPAAIGSLWNVREDDANELFTHFHRHFRDGYDADVALQMAQIDMLRHPKRLFHSATAWASFQLIGFASSPFLSEKGKR